MEMDEIKPILEEDQRQPDLGEEGNEREYLRPAAQKAYKKVCNDTLEEFYRVSSPTNTTYWKPTQFSNIDKWTGTMRSCDSKRHGMQIYRLKEKTTISMERMVTMCCDFNPKSRHWDPLIQCNTVLETFEKLNMHIVHWECRYPNWFSSSALSKRSAISIVCGNVKQRYVVVQHIMAHRHYKKKDNETLMDGWCVLYLTENNTVVIVVAINPFSTIVSPVATQLEMYYLNMLHTRIELMEKIHKTWNQFYLN
jgi:hypothetical protein